MELSCKEMVEALQARKHELFVLTSRYRVGEKPLKEIVSRTLYLEIDFVEWFNGIHFLGSHSRRRKQNRRHLIETIRWFRPDVLYIWGMWNLHHEIAYDAECLMQGRVLYRFGDYWPTLPSQAWQYWKEDGRNFLSKHVKRFLRPFAQYQLGSDPTPALMFPHCYCISNAVKQELLSKGVPVAHSHVIYNGVEIEPFLAIHSNQKSFETRPLRILYAGRMSEEKGIHILIDTLAWLIKQKGAASWELTLAGPGSAHDLMRLHSKIASERLEEVVTFLGQVEHSQMPQLLASHHILVAPSLWPEPFGRAVIEGMASGCLVITSEVGALPEIVQHMETGMLVEAGNVAQLASALDWSANNIAATERLASQGQQAAMQFSTRRVADQVEAILSEIAMSSHIPAIEFAEPVPPSQITDTLPVQC